MLIAEIADQLGRDLSTIYRDIKRSRYTGIELPELNGYQALVSEDIGEISEVTSVMPKARDTGRTASVSGQSLGIGSAI